MDITIPGVYVSEIPAGGQDIAGVATSITAFMGTALCGPLGFDPLTNETGAREISSFGDYERMFGGLWQSSPMSYAVRDFFQNGGSQAIIVRLYEPFAVPAGTGGRATVPANAPGLPPEATPLNLIAASPGGWGNDVRVMVDTDGIAEGSGEFNLSVFYVPGSGATQTERFLQLSVADGPESPGLNRLDLVLAKASQFVRAAPGAVPATPDSDWFIHWSAFGERVKGLAQDKIISLLSAGSGGNDGQSYLSSAAYTVAGTAALDSLDLFNLLCIPYDPLPPDGRRAERNAIAAYAHLADYCMKRRAMMVLDPPSQWQIDAHSGQWAAIQVLDLNIKDAAARNAAVYFPRVMEADPLQGDQLRVMPACGLIAGVYAATDAAGGVWKAPAGTSAVLSGIADLEVHLNDAENGVLNPLGINSLRNVTQIGPVVWGARTLRGSDELSDDYKYVPVRRLALYIEESIYRGTKWAVFEPNDERLWSSLRLTVGSFLAGLEQQGAFYSYTVACDGTTTTPDDIAAGIVNVIIGIAPVKPAEFVVIQIQQMAAQAS